MFICTLHVVLAGKSIFPTQEFPLASHSKVSNETESLTRSFSKLKVRRLQKSMETKAINSASSSSGWGFHRVIDDHVRRQQNRKTRRLATLGVGRSDYGKHYSECSKLLVLLR